MLKSDNLLLTCSFMNKMHTPLTSYFYCVLWTSLIFIIFGWDALMNHGVLGYDGAEIWAFVWGHHWMDEALRNYSWPYETNLLDFPNGGVLWLKDPIMLILMHPIRSLFGIQKAVLLSQYLLFLLASLSTFIVAQLHHISVRLSIFCGLAYAFCPHAIGEAYNGNLEAISHGWLPLWFASWIALLENPSLKRSILAALTLFVLLVSNQYWGIAMAFSGIATLPMLYKHNWKKRGLILSSVIGGGFLFIPIARSIWGSLHAPFRLNDVTGGSVPQQPPYLSDITELWAPLSQSAEQTPFQDILYVGLLLIVISFFALFSTIQNKSRNYFHILYPLLGVWYLILMLGPVLYYKGHIVQLAQGERIHLPWWYLFQKVEVLSWMTLPHRMAIPASLFLTLSASIWLNQQKHFSWLFCAILLEIWLVPPYQIPIVSTTLLPAEHAGFLSTLPKGAVLNLPINLYSNTQRKYLWYQTQHKYPIAAHFRYSMLPRISEKSGFLSYSFDIKKAPLPSAENLDPLEKEALYEAGYRYIVVHKEFIQEQLHMSHEEYARWMNIHMGEGIILDDAYVYPLDKSIFGEHILSYRSTFSLGLP